MGIRMEVKINKPKEMTIQQAQNVLFKSMLKMQELAMINCAVDTGRLRNSINVFPYSSGFDKYVLSDGVNYGVHMEFGTSPHYVSASHLKDWARRKLGNENAAYAVARKIQMEGMEGQPFFRPALDQVKGIWVSRYFEDMLK